MERNYNSGSHGGGFGPKPPVNQGDVLEVEIEAVGEKGDGIARKDGFVLFIPGVKEGDRVKVKVTRVLRKVGFAEVVGEGTEEAHADEVQSEKAHVAEPEPEPEPEIPSEDTEDFGEEVTEEASVEEEAPAEEPAEEEAPAEEVEAPKPPAEE